MSSFQNRFERLELKFVIDEIRADRIRRQIAAYCEADSHCALACAGTPSGYPIQSLYLDTPSLAFHAAKERGDPDRVKLRARTYAGSTTVSLEIKRRRANVIDKRRFTIPRDSLARAAIGMLDGRDLLRGDSRDVADFAHVVATSGASPKLTVTYRREAYESRVDPYARVTFDRGIRVRPTQGWDLKPDDRHWIAFDEHWKTSRGSARVVLELKCETAIPSWMIELIRTNQLEPSTFSKYSIGICLSQLRGGVDASRSRSLGALA